MSNLGCRDARRIFLARFVQNKDIRTEDVDRAEEHIRSCEKCSRDLQGLIESIPGLHKETKSQEMGMECETALQHIPTIIDWEQEGISLDAELAEVKRHIEECPICSVEYKTTKEALDLYYAGKLPEPEEYPEFDLSFLKEKAKAVDVEEEKKVEIFQVAEQFVSRFYAEQVGFFRDFWELLRDRSLDAIAQYTRQSSLATVGVFGISGDEKGQEQKDVVAVVGILSSLLSAREVKDITELSPRDRKRIIRDVSRQLDVSREIIERVLEFLDSEFVDREG